MSRDWKNLSSRTLVLALVASTWIAATANAAEVESLDALLPPPAERPINFRTDVLPLLSHRCFSCHADDKAEGELKLNTRDAALGGGKSGPAIVPGSSKESLLVRLAAGLDPERMMPAEGDPLTREEIGLLRAWIDQGAAWVEARPYALELRTVVVPPGDGHPLDRLLAPYFAQHDVEAADPIDDARFARRTSLDLLGLPPTPPQLAAFLADGSADKRAQWVDRLLADQENYAAHWMTFWSDHLRIGSEVNSGTFDDDNTAGPKKWLKGQLDQNSPLNRLASDMLTSEFYNQFAVSVAPKGDFISVVERAEMQMATLISQVFLGVQMKCASCHDSFVDRWKLQDAWGLAVALGDEPIEIHRCQTSTGNSAHARFPLPELGPIDPQADVAARRQRVAELLTTSENGLFARTFVNRLWARLFGRGLIEPLDEMMEHEPWSADVLDWLAAELIRCDYDVKRLVRLIVSSQAYQRPAVVRDQPIKGDDYVFRGPEMRWLTAEQFVDSVLLLVQTPPIDGSPVRLPQRSWELTGSRLMTMLGRPTRDVVVSARVQEPTPLLALELINGGEFQQLTMQAATAQCQANDASETIGVRLYATLLSRRPTLEEQEVAVRVLGSPPTPEGVNDLIWSMAMLPEFQLVP